MRISEGVIRRSRNTLLDLHNSSYHTQPHPIIVNCSQFIDRIVKEGFAGSWELAIARRALASERHRLQVKTHLYIFLCVTTR